MKIRNIAVVLCLVFIGSAFSAESERICRFCQTTDVLPFGTNLEGAGRRYAPDRKVDILHIKIDVTPDFKKRTVAGTTTLTFAPISEPLKTLRLDAVNLAIRDVKSGEVVDDFVSTEEDLRIVFESPIPVGKKAAVTIQYDAQPKAGLYFRTPEMGYPESDTHLWTQGETHEARHWFPCFDYPNERSSTEIICHVPKEMTVISNGEQIAETVDGQTGLKSVHWLQAKPHVNYLICLVAGHFKKLEKNHRELKLGFYVQPSLFEHASNSFEDTEKIMEFFENEIGIPFPWKKYDQVTIRDFVAGGMENTTLTTLYHGTIFSTETENLQTSRRLDAHEMAHQWFGDYVTCKDWSHLWLNEGFATFYTHLYEGHKFGQDAMTYGLYLDATERVLSSRNEYLPIIYNEYKNPMQQFDYRSYPKGSWVLHMLRCQLGPELYRQCIKAYLETHSLSSVISDDLRQVIEEKSGRPFDRFFDQWLYHGRHPDLKIEYEWLPEQKLAKVTIEQTQKVDDNVLLFHLPAKTRFHVNGEVFDHEVEIDQAKMEFYAPLPSEPSIVRFDPDYTILADVSFKKSDELLFAQIKNADDMIGRLLSAKALGERDTHKAIEYLKEAIATDQFFGVRIQAAKSLEKIGNDEAFEALKNSSEQPNAMVRLEVIRAITKKHREDSLDVIINILNSEKNPEIKAEAVKALGRFPVAISKNHILNALQTETFGHELIHAALSAINSQKDSTYQQPIIEAMRATIKPWQTDTIARGLSTLATISSRDDDKSDAKEVIVSYLTDPKEVLRIAALNALGTLADPTSAALIETFVSDNQANDRLTNAAKSAQEKLSKQSPLAPQELIELRNLARDLKEQNKKLQADLEDVKKQVESINGSESAK